MLAEHIAEDLVIDGVSLAQGVIGQLIGTDQQGAEAAAGLFGQRDDRIRGHKVGVIGHR